MVVFGKKVNTQEAHKAINDTNLGDQLKVRLEVQETEKATKKGKKSFKKSHFIRECFGANPVRTL